MKVGCYKNDHNSEGTRRTSDICYQNHQSQRTELDIISGGLKEDKGKALKQSNDGIIISFNDLNMEGVRYPHDDPLVIIPMIGNSQVKRVLVDIGESVDVLFHNVLYHESQLTPCTLLIYRFDGEKLKMIAQKYTVEGG